MSNEEKLSLNPLNQVYVFNEQMALWAKLAEACKES